MDPINDTAGTNIASESNTEDNSHNINDGEMTDSDKNAVGAIDTAVSKSNADEGTQIENVSEVTGATHHGETTEPLDDDDCSMGFCDWISIGLIVFFLGLYIADVVTDIDLAVEYSNKGLANYFCATLACIIIPHLLVAFTDFCMLWEDRKNIMAHMKKQTEDESIKQGGEENVEMITPSYGNEPEVKSQSPESTGSTHSNGGNGPRRASLKACIPFDFTTKTECFCFRGILCLFWGIIIRKFECIYYTIKVKKERNVQLRQWYNCKLLEATRDSTNLGFICAFTGDVFQLLLQLHIFVQNPVPIHERIGVGMMKRTMAGKTTPVCEISVDGDVITISTNAAIKTQSEKFKLGEEFETEANDAKGKVVVTFEDGRFVMTPSSANKAKFPKTSRYIVGTEMCLELQAGDVVCKRFFKRA